MRNTFIAFMIGITASTLHGQERQNIIVLLDLSDRILMAGQDQRDIAAISQVYRQFEELVRKQLYLKSEDAFRVVLLPQRGVPYDRQALQAGLSIDLRQVHKLQRAQTMQAFDKTFAGRLEKVYKATRYSEKSTDYAGVDIWQFFNEQMSYLLETDSRNRVFLITDGYLDFEDYGHQLREGNKYTSTCFLKELRVPDWKGKAEKGGYGILPIRTKLPEMEVCVVGLQPKVHDLNEVERMRYFITLWFKDIGTNDVLFMPNGSGNTSAVF